MLSIMLFCVQYVTIVGTACTPTLSLLLNTHSNLTAVQQGRQVGAVMQCCVKNIKMKCSTYTQQKGVARLRKSAKLPFWLNMSKISANVVYLCIYLFILYINQGQQNLVKDLTNIAMLTVCLILKCYFMHITKNTIISSDFIHIGRGQ